MAINKAFIDEEFNDWLDQIQHLLPRSMTTAECKKMFAKKIKEEERENDEVY
jgi:hypothetical protein